jgi:hypothetical protein
MQPDDFQDLTQASQSTIPAHLHTIPNYCLYLLQATATNQEIGRCKMFFFDIHICHGNTLNGHKPRPLAMFFWNFNLYSDRLFTIPLLPMSLYPLELHSVIFQSIINASNPSALKVESLC